MAWNRWQLSAGLSGRFQWNTHLAIERERILAQARQVPDREQDGTAVWSLQWDAPEVPPQSPSPEAASVRRGAGGPGNDTLAWAVPMPLLARRFRSKWTCSYGDVHTKRPTSNDLDDFLHLFPDHSQAKALRDLLQQHLEKISQ